MDSLSTQSGLQVRHRQLHSRWFAAASASSLLDTSPHLGRQQLFLCYRLHPETPHTTLRRPVPRGPRLLLCLSAELLGPAERVASYRPNTLSRSLACCSEAHCDRATQCRPAGRQRSYRQSIRPKCDLSRLRAALCPYTAVAFSHWPINRRAWRWLV